MTKYIFLVVALIGFVSCEKETSVGYIVKNDSSTKIYVSGVNVVYATPISHIIPALGGSEILARWSKTGKSLDLMDPTTMFGQDLLITNTNGDTLTKNYANIANWDTDVEETKGTAKHTYVLNVTDADF